jgi:hypothetical protein
VFAADPAAAESASVGEHRERAAQAAARVEGAERGAWRAQAAAWLREALDSLRRRFVAGQLTPADLRRRLAVWRHDPVLSLLLPDLQHELADLEKVLALGEPAAAVHAPFDAAYAFRSLGPPPDVLRPYGGILFDPEDPDLLVVAAHAQSMTASLCAAQLERDASGHVAGFRASRRLAAAPFADGGVARGPKGTLLYTRYPNAEIGELRAGGRGPERIEKLAGAGASAGGFAIVPAGLPGAGRAKFLCWPGGQWHDAELAPGPGGFALERQRQVTTLPGGPDGFAFVAAGSPCFERPAVLVAEWSAQCVVAYELDPEGNPVRASRRLVLSGLRGVLGVAIDPVTGDVLLSTWRRDGTEVIGMLRRTGR